MRHRRRLLLNLAVASLIALILSAAFLTGFLYTAQASGADFLFKAKSGEKSQRVVIIAFDNQTVRELAASGRIGALPRSNYAKLVDVLAQAGARVIVFDVLFDTPSPDDGDLARAVQQAGNVVMATAGDLPSLVVSSSLPFQYQKQIKPRPEIASAAAGLGHGNVSVESDGTVRRIPLVITADKENVPALSLAAAASYLRRPNVIEQWPSADSLPFAGRRIPLGANATMLVNYLGGPSRAGSPSTFTVLSLNDTLNGRADLSIVRDKIVLIGVMATGIADDHWTPPSVAGRMYGVEIHANAIETILQSAFLTPESDLAVLASIFLLALITVPVVVRLRPLLATIAAFGLWGIYLLTSFISFDNGLFLNLVYPPLSIAFTFLALMVNRVLFEESEQRVLRGVLNQYLSPAVTKEVLKSPESLGLSGSRRVMTVLFSDIRGFTTIAEGMEPEELVHFLNEYMTRMTDIVFKHGGVLDKYMGDGLMAFWGAPVEQPDHARRACEAALEMRQELAKLKRERPTTNSLEIGIGANTGPMMVGNMGSQRRFEYTVLGDAVNLASRLEGLNKEYGTQITIGEETRAQLNNEYTVRMLDLVVVKGKTRPVSVYELVGLSRDLSAIQQDNLRSYERGLSLYRERRFAEAVAEFERALAIDPRDGPARVYLGRCQTLASEPPSPDWDGVFVARRK